MLFTGFYAFSGIPFVTEIYFESGKDHVDSTLTHQLDSILDLNAKFQIRSIKVLGFTDNEGSEIYNYALSKGRADHVKAHLLERGIPAEFIEVFYFGETQQKGKAASLNRMVRVLIYYQEEDKKPFNVRPIFFDKLPFDINGDSIVDFMAEYVLIGHESHSHWKCTIRQVESINQSFLTHFDMKTKSFLMAGDTLKDYANKKWSNRADVLVRQKSPYIWGPSRNDIKDQAEFYCGLKFTIGTQSFLGWIKFRVEPTSGELLVLDKEMKRGDSIIVGAH